MPESTDTRSAETHFEHLAIEAASPRDAWWISRLYRAAYARKGTEDAADHYPFPQFMDDAWLVGAIERDEMLWVVARFEDAVVGVVGAARNVCLDDGRVAELFGLVVDNEWRGNRVATRLFTHLFEELALDTSFMIAETRTANAGGWRTARKFGFFPIGFEPFAHQTPVGVEPMLLLAHVSDEAAEQRERALRMSPAALKIARPVLRGMESYLPDPSNPRDCAITSVACASDTRLEIGSPSNIREIRFDFRVLEGESCAESDVHSGLPESGVVATARIEGRDLEGKRYTRVVVDGMHRDQCVATAAFTLDGNDHRARVTSCRVVEPSLALPLIRELAYVAERFAGDGPFTMVLDARADDVDLQAILEHSGFFPSAYYPAFVTKGSHRTDTIQYTRLWRQEFRDSLSLVEELGWPEAERVVESVTALAEDSAKTTVEA